MCKVLQQAKIYAPNIEPMEAIKLLAKSNTGREISRILGIAPATMRRFIAENGIDAIEHTPEMTARKISATQQKNQFDAVVMFKCDKINYGCGKEKPIALRDVHNPKICALCAKNRRRNLV